MSDVILDFIELVKQNPEIFSAEEQNELLEQKWSNDVDEIENTILEVHESKILNYYDVKSNIAAPIMSNLADMDKEKRNIFEKTDSTKNATQAPEIKPEDYRKMLIEAIQHSFVSQSQAISK